MFAIFQANAVRWVLWHATRLLYLGNTDVTPTTFCRNLFFFLVDPITGVNILVTFQCVQFCGRVILDLLRRSAYVYMHDPETRVRPGKAKLWEAIICDYL